MICDWSDDFWTGGFGMRPEDLDRLTEMADRVVTVNEAVAQRVKHGRVAVCGNGTNPEAFTGRDEGFVLPPILPKPAGERYVGFTGGLNVQRADRALLERVFHAFPNWRFVFVGYTDTPAMRNWVESFANTVFVDEVPYSDLRHVIASFDVAMVPHLDNEHTKGNDLLKVLDYLACGVPVVSTDSSGVRQYGAAVRVANDHAEFERMLRESVAARASHDPELGWRMIKDRSWAAQTRRLLQELEWADPKVAAAGNNAGVAK
jgi:glycosyltransferase involved in cell wall biosynthesis